ncbi:hypothetical protein [Paraburkholderia acidisoli]|uniref:Uncharacterized protein n=1 Tax=Paraburkholderia acidisoli TaxID=2571748 RepID=A0A7Z2GQC0_9BURK|nr:hypothetical protein [Paraburkholderia acidisoli]QGZ65629.1 hypothetical protein FAZ98_28220 [Paraburkholderia acidisoli]
MNLELAAASLSRRGLGLTDLREFALQCRDGASRPGSHAAVLILLAEKASAFFERYEGIAMSNDALNEFVRLLAGDVETFRLATAQGDVALVEALNAFASLFSRELAI